MISFLQFRYFYFSLKRETSALNWFETVLMFKMSLIHHQEIYSLFFRVREITLILNTYSSKPYVLHSNNTTRLMINNVVTRVYCTVCYSKMYPFCSRVHETCMKINSQTECCVFYPPHMHTQYSYMHSIVTCILLIIKQLKWPNDARTGTLTARTAS
jgi:hypothetical protein